MSNLRAPFAPLRFGVNHLWIILMMLSVTVHAAEAERATERSSVTTHTLVVEGGELAYTATAGTLLLGPERGDEIEPRARLFYIAYTRDGVEDPSRRPVTFAFNGGPGSSSVWLHLGLLGPRRVELGDADGLSAPPPPGRLVDNEYSLLDVTDLVFIDPVSTGFSRVLPEQDARQYHGVSEDIRSVGEFIRLWTTRNGRWHSPKFLIGESYGTLRAAGLAKRLQDELGIYLNGVMLVSTVLDFGTLQASNGNDLPFVTYLPSFAATAWYHGRLGEALQRRPLEEVVAEAREFAIERYAPALLKGSGLGEAEREAIVNELARLTGLSPAFIESHDLRVGQQAFSKELLRKRGLIIGRFDGRVVGHDRLSAGERPDYDPSYAALLGPMTAALNQYVRGELQFESDLNYEILTGDVHPWTWDDASNRYLSMVEPLRRAMVTNPHLRVFVANGYYDLATPVMAAEHSVAHLGLPEELRDHLTMGYYPAGHMMYTHLPSLEQLKSDLSQFIQGAVQAP